MQKVARSPAAAAAIRMPDAGLGAARLQRAVVRARAWRGRHVRHACRNLRPRARNRNVRRQVAVSPRARKRIALGDVVAARNNRASERGAAHSWTRRRLGRPRGFQNALRVGYARLALREPHGAARASRPQDVGRSRGRHHKVGVKGRRVGSGCKGAVPHGFVVVQRAAVRLLVGVGVLAPKTRSWKAASSSAASSQAAARCGLDGGQCQLCNRSELRQTGYARHGRERCGTVCEPPGKRAAFQNFIVAHAVVAVAVLSLSSLAHFTVFVRAFSTNLV